MASPTASSSSNGAEEDLTHAARLRAQEQSLRKAHERITLTKTARSGSIGALEQQVAGTPPLPISVYLGSDSSPARASRAQGASSPLFSRTRSQTEEELFDEGLREYLPLSRSIDGHPTDPRDHLFEAIPAPFEESEDFQRVIEEGMRVEVD